MILIAITTTAIRQLRIATGFGLSSDGAMRLLDNLPEGSQITRKNCYGNPIGTISREELFSDCRPGNRKYDLLIRRNGEVEARKRFDLSDLHRANW